VDIRGLQDQILVLARARARGPLSDEIVEAFLATPRQGFVPRFLGTDGRWKTPSDADYLPSCYADVSLTIWQTGPTAQSAAPPVATISQPSFVLEMLRILDLHPGHNVLEIGAGSGWNQALMARLVGRFGKVTSVEILPELARAAQDALLAAGVSNAEVVAGDGARGHPARAPFDRIVYTTSTPCLPMEVVHQLNEGGKLLLVLAVTPDLDCLILFERRSGDLHSTDVRHCRFVPLAGELRARATAATSIQGLLDSARITSRVPQRRACWFGIDSPADFGWYSSPLRLYLALQSGRAYRAVSLGDGAGFALVTPGSVALARYGVVEIYGSERADQRLQRLLRCWVRDGMPTADGWRVTAVPTTTGRARALELRRGNTTFRWQLKR
jgi:protein-L-isoaspartate(D-aspartate) O-methyltransferase